MMTFQQWRKLNKADDTFNAINRDRAWTEYYDAMNERSSKQSAAKFLSTLDENRMRSAVAGEDYKTYLTSQNEQIMNDPEFMALHPETRQRILSDVRSRYAQDIDAAARRGDISGAHELATRLGITPVVTATDVALQGGDPIQIYKAFQQMNPGFRFNINADGGLNVNGQVVPPSQWIPALRANASAGASAIQGLSDPLVLQQRMAALKALQTLNADHGANGGGTPTVSPTAGMTPNGQVPAATPTATPTATPAAALTDEEIVTQIKEYIQNEEDAGRLARVAGSGLNSPEYQAAARQAGGQVAKRNQTLAKTITEGVDISKVTAAQVQGAQVASDMAKRVIDNLNAPLAARKKAMVDYIKNQRLVLAWRANNGK